MLKIKKFISIWVIIFLFAWGFIFYYMLGNMLHGISINETIGYSIYYIVLFAFITVIIKFIEKKDFKDFGLTFNKIIKQLILGILFAIILISSASIIFRFIYGNLQSNISIPVGLMISHFIFFILLGLTEELIFRGYLFNKFILIFKSKIYVIIISSIVFALWHYPTNWNVDQVIISFFIGIYFSILRFKFNNNIILLLAICHTLYDFSHLIPGIY